MASKREGNLEVKVGTNNFYEIATKKCLIETLIFGLGPIKELLPTPSGFLKTSL
jgi:hypothetical protein